jgi:Leucine Rich repeat
VLAGAEELISMIKARRTVHRLVLGHNELGDDGCVALFTFLAGSSDGRKYHIAYISLNANEIGERGLLAIAEYLKDNQHLKHLLLQNVCMSSIRSTATS